MFKWILGNRMVTISFARLWRRGEKYNCKNRIWCRSYFRRKTTRRFRIRLEQVQNCNGGYASCSAGHLLLLIIRAYKKANRWILTERRADLAMRLLISERAAITQAAEVVVAVPAHVRVPVPEAGEPDARKKIFTEQSLRQWQSARRWKTPHMRKYNCMETYNYIEWNIHNLLKLRTWISAYAPWKFNNNWHKNSMKQAGFGIIELSKKQSYFRRLMLWIKV